MTTDGGGYSYIPCRGCANVSRVTEEDGCKLRGLGLVIPRSQAHWQSIASFITETMNSTFETYLKVVPGIYKPFGGRHDCEGGMGVMNYEACFANNTWRATDGGKWWLRSTNYDEANGNYHGDCYLGGIPHRGWGGNASAIRFHGNACDFFTGNPST